MHFDLIVIGSGPAGQKGAIAAAKLGRKVAIIDKQAMYGGVSLHGGTIPSKTLREAILFLFGLRQRAFYGHDYTVKEEINHEDLVMRVRMVEDREMRVIRDQLKRNRIQMFFGMASFRDEKTVLVEGEKDQHILTADNFLIACGTHPVRDPAIPFDGETIIDVDQILDLQDLPRKLIVVGAGVIGLEYASMFAAMNIDVTLIDQREDILNFVDHEIIDRLKFSMMEENTVFRLGETLHKVEKERSDLVKVTLESGKIVRGDTFLYAVGRQTNADSLHLDAIGLKTDGRGRISVNRNFQTELEHVYAAGDVIGFPALAATSMEQGRLACCNMFCHTAQSCHELLPFGIYTIPEISMVGKTEQELTRDKIPYEFGTARYDELAKGQILGAKSGFVKILFDPVTLKLLGVHIIGDQAAELIHIGQVVMSLSGTVEYFRDTVFNYPTLAEAYKVAALNGLNKLQKEENVCHVEADRCKDA
ncbi:MAG: Si-specific NAD(P)(+) transhydrogenase [Desulfopila sp.]|jgi:NAD(P) transhydrogenase|nr:Si-specific NAD(P)(+) transhydrogenase [Desulfopila sp.]